MSWTVTFNTRCGCSVTEEIEFGTEYPPAYWRRLLDQPSVLDWRPTEVVSLMDVVEERLFELESHGPGWAMYYEVHR